MKIYLSTKFVVDISPHTVSRRCNQNFLQTRPSVRVHWVACGTCSVPRNFLQVGGGGGGGHPEVIPEVIPAEALWLTGPHTFVRRNRSFSEVKNLATGLLINHLSERRNCLLG